MFEGLEVSKVGSLRKAFKKASKKGILSLEAFKQKPRNWQRRLGTFAQKPTARAFLAKGTTCFWRLRDPYPFVLSHVLIKGTIGKHRDALCLGLPILFVKAFLKVPLSFFNSCLKGFLSFLLKVFFRYKVGKDRDRS